MKSKMAASTHFNVYVAAENGLFKAVNTESRLSTNLNSIKSLQRGDQITATLWGNKEETEVCLGLKNQTLKIYDAECHEFVHTQDVKAGTGTIVGLGKYQNKYITCVESGIVKVWNDGVTDQFEINAGENLCRMVQNPHNPCLLATGGKENDLKLWNIEKPQAPIFCAKNVRTDFLDLRVPVWVLNMKYLPNGEKIVVTTGHHNIRVYDPSSNYRRPVIDMEFESYPIGALSLAHEEHQIVVGNNQGRMALVDLRKKAMVHVYKGFAGAIRDIQCHPSLPHVASCGLDRFLRIHHLQTHKLLVKMYLKSSLKSILFKTKTDGTENKSYESIKETDNNSIENVDDSDDDLWANMKIVSEKKKRKKATTDTEHQKKNKSPSIIQSETGPTESRVQRKKKKMKN